MQPPRVDDRDDTEDEDNAAARDVGHCEEGMGMDREDGRDDDVGGGLRNEHKDMRSRRERDEVVATTRFVQFPRYKPKDIINKPSPQSHSFINDIPTISFPHFHCKSTQRHTKHATCKRWATHHVSYEEATAAADSYTTVHNAAAELWPRHLPLH